MATKCIDISENKKIGNVSPISIFVWIIIYVVATAFMAPGFAYLLVLAVGWILTQIFFEYTPRFIFLFLKFIFTNNRLTPSFQDRKYFAEHKQIPNLRKILPQENAQGIE